MEPKYKVIIDTRFMQGRKTIKIKEEYHFQKAEGATSFAEGYAQALYWVKAMNEPYCPQLDGYHWWEGKGEDFHDIIKAIRSEDGKYITRKDFEQE